MTRTAAKNSDHNLRDGIHTPAPHFFWNRESLKQMSSVVKRKVIFLH
jgi:hypothetical protein